MRIAPKDMLVYYCNRMMHYSSCQWSIKTQEIVELVFRFLQDIVEWILFLPVMIWCLFEVVYKTIKAYIKIWRGENGTNL